MQLTTWQIDTHTYTNKQMALGKLSLRNQAGRYKILTKTSLANTQSCDWEIDLLCKIHRWRWSTWECCFDNNVSGCKTFSPMFAAWIIIVIWSAAFLYAGLGCLLWFHSCLNFSWLQLFAFCLKYIIPKT